jgi:hypothetical protein
MIGAALVLPEPAALDRGLEAGEIDGVIIRGKLTAGQQARLTASL